MSDDNRLYYLAAGASLAKAQEIIAQRKECNDRRDKFKRRLRAKDLIVSSDSIVAVLFRKDPPPGWIPNKHFRGSFKPSTKTAEGRKIAAEMDALRWASDDALGHIHCGWSEERGGICLTRPHLELIGDQHVISQHNSAKPPADAVPLKKSEYWRLKEEAAPEQTGGSAQPLGKERAQ